jgi:Zn finger protein HypA/HybF involved in hydrogenase expression
METTPELTLDDLKKLKAKSNMMKKHNFEIMFNDSPEYFLVERAKMIFEKNMVRFICFDTDNSFKCNEWFPMCNVSRIKGYTF